MADKNKAMYLTDSEKNFKELNRLYDDFIKQYDIESNKSELIIKKRSDGEGIEISPKAGEIFRIKLATLPSKLEIQLIESDWREGCCYQIFETKDNKFIKVNYKK